MKKQMPANVHVGPRKFIGEMPTSLSIFRQQLTFVLIDIYCKNLPDSLKDQVAPLERASTNLVSRSSALLLLRLGGRDVI